MSQQIDAIYDNGVLRPLVPLSLPDQARVKLSIEVRALTPVVDPQDGWEQHLLSLAKDCGISLSDAAVSTEGLYE